jgi:hypothetical protein
MWVVFVGPFYSYNSRKLHELGNFPRPYFSPADPVMNVASLGAVGGISRRIAPFPR